MSKQDFRKLSLKGVDPITRFWLRVNKNGQIHPIYGQCWEWKTPAKNSGRGSILVNGKRIYAYRFSWQIHYGEVPRELFVCHRCDNPTCVRPEHLFVGTRLDNMLDCISKGKYNCESRASPGEANGSAKLTTDAVSEIRRRYVRGINRSRPSNSEQLANEFGVTAAQILNIANGRAWK